MRTYLSSVELPVPAGQAFAWHERPGAFERLAPPWRRVEVLDRRGGLRDGGQVTLRVPFGPLRLRWQVEHQGYRPGREFTDVQVSGPFRRWLHRHRFEDLADGRSRLTDEVAYDLPLGRLGGLAAGRMDESLGQLFRYRHHLTAWDLALHAAHAERPRKKVAISGASGLIGSTLVHLLTTGGHRVLRLVRRPAEREDEVQWSPTGGVRDLGRLDGVDAVVHLAGESLLGPWTDARRRRIRESRVIGTRVLSAALAGLREPPGTLVTASAVGFYGDRGPEALTEETAPGQGFLAEVCQGWEAATRPAVRRGIRVVNARMGVVMSPRGGALAAQLKPARAGLAARLGDGRQYVSWVSLDDAVSALYHAVMDPELRGPVNVTAPEPVRQAELTEILARVLHRPALARVPARLARTVLGDLADEVLLGSTRALPRRLVALGYRFRDPSLEGALRRMLGRMEPGSLPPLPTEVRGEGLPGPEPVSPGSARRRR